MSAGSIVFDRAADYYDQTRGFPPGMAERAAELLVSAGRLEPSSRLIELGVGTGRIALPLAAHVRHVQGVDLSRQMLGRLLEKRRTERVSVSIADITRLPFADASFDAAVAVHIFHLVPDYRQALREAARVLKSNGCLIHAWGDNTVPPALDRVWREVTGKGRAADIGMNWEARKTMLQDNGWRPIGEEARLPYIVERSPLEYVEQIRQRCWSHTWCMSDEELDAGLRGLRAFIDAHYERPEASERVEVAFVARAYAPPR